MQSVYSTALADWAIVHLEDCTHIYVSPFLLLCNFVGQCLYFMSRSETEVFDAAMHVQLSVEKRTQSGGNSSARISMDAMWYCSFPTQFFGKRSPSSYYTLDQFNQLPHCHKKYKYPLTHSNQYTHTHRHTHTHSKKQTATKIWFVCIFSVT